MAPKALSPNLTEIKELKIGFKTKLQSHPNMNIKIKHSCKLRNAPSVLLLRVYLKTINTLLVDVSLDEPKHWKAEDGRANTCYKVHEQGYVFS